jgi:hypothetical protein
MTATTIDKIVTKLKKFPEDKLPSLLDYIDYLKNQTKTKSSNKNKKPNKLTSKAINDVENKKNLTKCKNADDMFKNLGI